MRKGRGETESREGEEEGVSVKERRETESRDGEEEGVGEKGER